MRLVVRYALALLVAIWAIACPAAGLPGAASHGSHVARGMEVLQVEEDEAPPYRVVAAYPYYRRAILGVDEIPWEYLHQIDHFSVKPGDEGTLVVPPGFLMPELIEGAHQAGVKVVLVAGGLNSHSAFSPVAADPVFRASFVQELKAFVVEHGYDGVLVDWEFPQSDTDRENLSQMMADLKTGLEGTGRDLELSIAVTSNENRGQPIDTGAIAPLVSHFLVMTFRYYGPLAAESGHNAPLYSGREGAGDSRSVDQSLRYWAETRGVPWSQIYMGVAPFGTWFDSEDLYQPFTATGQVAYRDIEPLKAAGFTYHWDAMAQVPYLTQDEGPKVLSYDDPRSVALKRDYVLANQLGGVALWDLTMDRVDGEHELLKVLFPTPAPVRILLPLVRHAD